MASHPCFFRQDEVVEDDDSGVEADFEDIGGGGDVAAPADEDDFESAMPEVAR